MAHVGIQRFAPVSARNTAPITIKVCPAARCITQRVQRSSASNTCGSRTICTRPSTPSTTNQTAMMGPNVAQRVAVPLLCTANSATSTINVSGITHGANAATQPANPIADSTEIAGVITLSPKTWQRRAPAPMAAVRRRPAAGSCRSTSANSARMPPSPSLSARSTSSTYLIDTISVTAQKIIDNTPKMASV